MILQADNDTESSKVTLAIVITNFNMQTSNLAFSNLSCSQNHICLKEVSRKPYINKTNG